MPVCLNTKGLGAFDHRSQKLEAGGLGEGSMLLSKKILTGWNLKPRPLAETGLAQ